MKAEEVVRYLQDNPGFFEDYAFLADVPKDESSDGGFFEVEAAVVP